MSFYLTLPSDASMNEFPENVQSNFTVSLETPINLNGNFEVALVEISYSQFISLDIGFLLIHDKKNVNERNFIPLKWSSVFSRKKLMLDTNFASFKSRDNWSLPDNPFPMFEFETKEFGKDF
jgi:hypothetical protein